MQPQPCPFTVQLFLDFGSIFFPRMAPQFFWYLIYQVIWPSPGTLDGIGTRPDYLVIMDKEGRFGDKIAQKSRNSCALNGRRKKWGLVQGAFSCTNSLPVPSGKCGWVPKKHCYLPKHHFRISCVFATLIRNDLHQACASGTRTTCSNMLFPMGQVVLVPQTQGQPVPISFIPKLYLRYG